MDIQSNRFSAPPGPDAAWSAAGDGVDANAPTDPTATLAESGDLGAEMAAMVVQSSRGEHDAARAERDAQEQLAQQQDAKVVQTLHDEASLIAFQGIFDATMTLGSAACKAAGSDSGEAVCSAVGKLGDSAFAGAQKADEADVESFKSQASQDRSFADDARDLASEATDTAKAAISFFQQYTSTVAQTQASILHRA